MLNPHRNPMTTARCALGIGALLLCCSAVQAQMYRVVGADGRVTYSDTPPAADARAAAPGAGSAAAGDGGGAALPYQLKQTAQRFPVTLYSGKDCTPCASGRNLLVNRGIPFSEKTVESNADMAALQSQFGGGNLPVVTIGGQRLSGFSDTEWSQYLDAAGYPKTSQLPRNYRRPAAAPLVAARAPAASAPAVAASANAPAAPAQPSVAPTRSATNPNAIRF